MKRDEFLQSADVWRFPTADAETEIHLEANSLAFSLCGVPVVYRLSDAQEIRVIEQAGKISRLQGNCLGVDFSRSLFKRDTRVERIEVDIIADSLN